MSEITIREGDAFELLEALPADFADCAVVDYPWQFNHQNGSGRYATPDKDQRSERGKRVSDIFSMESDERVPELLEELSRVLSDGSWALFPADDRFMDILRDALRDSEFTLRRNWAWTPNAMGMGYYGRVDHYPIPAATLGETDRYVTGRGTLYDVNRGRPDDYPTQKPVRLYRQLLEDPVLRNGDRLIEPFCGTAPAAAVCNSRHIDYWGCDLETDAVDIARGHTEQTTAADFVDT